MPASTPSIAQDARDRNHAASAARYGTVAAPRRCARARASSRLPARPPPGAPRTPAHGLSPTLACAHSVQDSACERKGEVDGLAVTQAQQMVDTGMHGCITPGRLEQFAQPQLRAARELATWTGWTVPPSSVPISAWV